MQNSVLQKLTDLGLQHTTYYHQALFTCDQAQEMAPLIPAAQCKNLFLKDNKKNLYLVVAVSKTAINLKALSKYLQAPALRFADAQLLKHHLGVEPGSVTPFGLIFDTQQSITVLLDSMLFKQEYIGFHPLENTATTVIAPQDFFIFLGSCKNNYTVIDFEKIEV